jgi:opacity protein-like surface antigen
MKAKLRLSILFLAFSSTALANTNNHQYYIAANAGIIEADFNNKFSDQTDEIPQNIAQTTEQHGYTGGIALGYRRLVNPFYIIGTELSVNIDGSTALFQSGASTTAFTDKLKLRNHIDWVLKLGTLVTETVEAYLKFGLSNASVQDNLTTPVGYLAEMTTFNDQENLIGFTAGLGFRKALNKHISVLTELNYHDYGTATFNDFQNFSATYTHSAHVYTYDAKVGIAYDFC